MKLRRERDLRYMDSLPTVIVGKAEHMGPDVGGKEHCSEESPNEGPSARVTLPGDGQFAPWPTST